MPISTPRSTGLEALGDLTSTEISGFKGLIQNSQIKRVVIGKLTGANMNTTNDQAIPVRGTSRYIVRGILVTNASISLDTAKGSVYTAASKGGTALTTNPTTTAYSALTTSAKYVELTLASLDVLTAGTLYLSLTTPQGAAATADFYIIGDILD